MYTESSKQVLDEIALLAKLANSFGYGTGTLLVSKEEMSLARRAVWCLESTPIGGTDRVSKIFYRSEEEVKASCDQIREISDKYRMKSDLPDDCFEILLTRLLGAIRSWCKLDIKHDAGIRSSIFLDYQSSQLSRHRDHHEQLSDIVGSRLFIRDTTLIHVNQFYQEHNKIIEKFEQQYISFKAELETQGILLTKPE